MIRIAALTTALLLAVAPAGARQGEAPPAERYRLHFAPTSAVLDTARSDNHHELARMVALLQQQGARPELAFVLVGELPAHCAPGLACAEALVLRRRAERAVEALQAVWPAAAPRGALSRLLWSHHFAPAGTLPEDLLELRVAPSGTAPAASCPFEVALRDPRLPPGLEDAAAPWLPAALPAAEPLAVGPGSALRLRFRGDPGTSILVLLEGPGGERRALLAGSGDPGAAMVEPLALRDGAKRLLLAAGAAAEALLGQGARGAGEELVAWPEGPILDESAPLAAGEPSQRCSLLLVPWR